MRIMRHLNPGYGQFRWMVLLLVGVLFGWIGTLAEADMLRQILRFIIGFGIVHIPAAVILFIKSQRGAGKS